MVDCVSVCQHYTFRWIVCQCADDTYIIYIYYRTYCQTINTLKSANIYKVENKHRIFLLSHLDLISCSHNEQSLCLKTHNMLKISLLYLNNDSVLSQPNGMCIVVAVATG